MKKILTVIFLFITILQVDTFAQVGKDYQLGSDASALRQRSIYGGFYDYSDPEAININVSVWGFVKYPGRYVIPEYTSVVDLLSYVGGPEDDSNLDELRIYRIENNKETMIPFNYNDLMWEPELEGKYKKVPSLKPSDILVVPGGPRLYFMDWFSIGLSVFSALISLTILIVTIQNK
ncbi:MAG: hypothetical protein KDC52_14335 [Ignavibacteriae bacterium]|nr:hypothetical protein [Ignavibacteriota bacterium]